MAENLPDHYNRKPAENKFTHFFDDILQFICYALINYCLHAELRGKEKEYETVSNDL